MTNLSSARQTTLLVQDVMVQRLITLGPKAAVLPAMHLLMKRQVTGAPVLTLKKVYCGVFSEKSSLNVAMTVLKAHPQSDAARPTAGHVMKTRLPYLHPDDDVMTAIGRLIQHRVSGLPVVDAVGNFLGVFSEKTSMSAILSSAFDQVPSGPVSTFTDPDPGRKVTAATPLEELVQRFLDTPYRRLVVVEGQRVIGLICRRDVIRAVLDWIETQGWASEDLGSVVHYMDTTAKTVEPELDLLSVSQIFQQTNFRRLPVLQGDLIAGQLSRRDVLTAFYQSLAPRQRLSRSPLYLSSVRSSEEAPQM